MGSTRTLADTARVIDGDTLEWKGERVRLLGFDAPEMKQTCERDGVTWLCGKEARKALANWIGAHDVKCEGDTRDKYGRLLAHCSVDGQDIGEWMPEPLVRCKTTANSLIKQHGEDAEIHAAMRRDELLDQGDVDGVFVWKRILEAVKELQSKPEGGTVH